MSIGCDEDKGNEPESTSGLHNPTPPYLAVDIPVVTEMSWSYNDTTGQQLMYDIYLGTTPQPPLYRSGLTDTTVVVGPLLMRTTYFWRVRVYSLTGDTTTSSVWRFSTSSSFTFPTATGNQWEYNRLWVFDNREPGEPVIEDTIFGTSTVTITGPATLADTLETIAVLTEWDETPGGTGSATDFWLEQSDGLYSAAYDNPWVGPPKRQVDGAVYYEIKGHRFANLDDLYRALRTGMSSSYVKFGIDTTLESPPVRKLAYPLEIGHPWDFRSTDLGHEWNMEKEIIDLDTVSLPIGTFEYYIVEWRWDMDRDGVWDTDISGYDWVSGGGTIKRMFDYPPVIYTNELGDSLGVLESSEEYMLIEYELR
jgi:hypothetical protein